MWECKTPLFSLVYSHLKGKGGKGGKVGHAKSKRSPQSRSQKAGLQVNPIYYYNYYK